MNNIRILNKSGHPLEYKTSGSIGLDLHAAIDMKRIIEPNRRWLGCTGISIEIPDGFGALVLPRSGLARDHGVVAVTGVIDSDYRGEIKVMLMNHGHDPYEVLPGDRIAQLVIVPIVRAVVQEVESLGSTDRNTSGFGSTGR